jgi:hypothetical protein
MILYFNFDQNGDYKLEENSNFALHLYDQHAKEFYDPNYQHNVMYCWIKSQLELIKEKYKSAVIKLELTKSSANYYYMFVVNIVDETEQVLWLLQK